MRLEGFLGGTVFKDLTIEGGTSTGIEAVGASGLDRRLLEFQDLLILGAASDAIGIAFVAPDQTTKNLRVQNCRFAGPMRAGVSIAGETDNVQLRLCRFNQVVTPIRFLDAGPFESVSVVNNTFRQFQQGIAFSVLPEVLRGGIGFHKNLFAGVEGPEVVVDGASAPVPPETILGQSGARFNWSEGAAASEVGSLGHLPAGREARNRPVDVPQHGCAGFGAVPGTTERGLAPGRAVRSPSQVHRGCRTGGPNELTTRRLDRVNGSP